MLISEKMVAALNTQIGNEFGAFIQYVQIASHFGRENLPELRGTSTIRRRGRSTR